jgi:hypothetical protein
MITNHKNLMMGKCLCTYVFFIYFLLSLFRYIKMVMDIEMDSIDNFYLFNWKVEFVLDV